MKKYLLLILFLLNLYAYGQKIKLGIPLGHSQSVVSALFSPDNKYIIALPDFSSTFYVWEFETGRLLYKMDDPDGFTISKIAISFSGSKIITTSQKDWGDAAPNRVTIYDLATGKMIRNILGHGSTINSLKFSHDESLLLTTSNDSTAKLWNPESGNILFTFHGHRAPVYDANFSPDDKYIVTAAGDNNVKIWDVASGKIVHTLEGHTDIVVAAVFSFDEKYIITASADKTIKIWDRLTFKLLYNLVGHTGKINTIDLSSDGETIVSAAADSTAIIWETKTGKLLHRLEGHTNVVLSAQYSPDGNFIVTKAPTFSVTDSIGSIKIWEAKTGKLAHNIKGNFSYGKHIQFSSDSKLLAVPHVFTVNVYDLTSGKLSKVLTGYSDLFWSNVSSPDGTLMLRSSGNGACINKISVTETQSGNIRFVKDIPCDMVFKAVFDLSGKYIVTALSDSTAKIFDSNSGALLYTLKGHRAEVRDIAFSMDGSLIATASLDSTIRIWNLASGELVNSFYSDGWDKNMLFTKDSKYIFTGSDTLKKWNIYTNELVLQIIGSKKHFHAQIDFESKFITRSDTWNGADSIEIWDANTGLLIRHIIGSNGCFSPTGDIYLNSFNKKKHIYNTQTWNIIKIIENDSINLLSRYSPNGKFLLGSSSNFDTLWLIDSQTYIPKFHFANTIYSITEFTNDSKYILQTYFDGTCKIITTTSGKEILSFLTLNNTDWVITHPSGLFDASPGAMEKMYWIQDMQTIDFSQLKDRYYEPGLWEKIMKDESLRSVKGLNEQIPLYPDIKLSEIDTNGNLIIYLTNQGGGIGKVKVYINGKEISEDIRGEKFDINAPNIMLTQNIKNHPFLIKGDTNTIQVKAYNGENWVISRGVIIKYIDRRESEFITPQLFLVSIGVSDYSGTDIDLKFPSKDAEDMYSALSVAAKRLFGIEKTHGYLLTSNIIEKKPTKDNIKFVFDEISKKATSADVIVIYLSGHGINWGGDNGDFYFLTQDAWSANSDAYNDDAIRNKSGISSQELADWIKAIPALKQVLIIDACASGRIVEDLVAKRDIPSNTIRSLDRMKDRTGLHIVTGCAADAVSFEASRYGQGVLTYSLLEGVKGISLREGRFLDILQWFQYARERVPLLAKGIGGIQEPQIISPYGSESFDIGQLNENDKKLIPLSSIKPMYIRSNFQDEDELEDIEGLGNKVDDALNDYSSKGNHSTIVFIDVKDFPDAYKLYGRYKREENKITVNIKVKRGQETITTLTLIGVNADEIVNQIINKINDF